MRELTIKDKDFYLNGKRIYIKASFFEGLRNGGGMGVEAMLGKQCAGRNRDEEQAERQEEQYGFQKERAGESHEQQHQQCGDTGAPAFGTLLGGIVKPVVEPSYEAPHPGHGVADALHEPLRISHGELDEHRKKR